MNEGAATESREAELTAFVAGLYDVVSGPAGARDWDTMRSLFVPGATLHGVRMGESESAARIRAQTLDEWLEGAREYFASAPLYERQVEARATAMGVLGHVFSEYESRHHPDSTPFQTGVNSILLVHTADGWRIATWVSTEQ